MAVVRLVCEVADHVERIARVDRFELAQQALAVLGAAFTESFMQLVGRRTLNAVDGLQERGPQRGHQKHCRIDVLRCADVRGVRSGATGRNQRRNPRPQRRRARSVENRKTSRLAHGHLRAPDLEPVVRSVGLGDAVSALFSVVSQAPEMYNALINIELDRCSGRSYPTDHVGEGNEEARLWLRSTG